MIRVILLNLLLLFLPALLYFAYVTIVRQFQPENTPVPNAPLLWLVLAGAALMIGGLIVFGNWEELPRDGKFYPAEVRDGKLVPGHVK